MARICGVEGCIYPVFGTDKNTNIGYCARHQGKRTDKKPKKPLFRTKRERIREFDFGFESQASLFDWLWENARNKQGRVICPYTDVDITNLEGTKMYYSCFAHVLPKGRFTYFKLNPKNIRVVNPAFHTAVDQSTSLQRENHPDWKFSRWYEEKEELRLAYTQFKRENLLA